MTDLPARPARRTKCQILEDQEAAVAAWPDDMPPEAASFEHQGWSMSLDLAPRCGQPDCWVCHG
jgi:hypothetical protein